jgi:CubicO group peptidase (beta-lactamase class C family)
VQQLSTVLGGRFVRALLAASLSFFAALAAFAQPLPTIAPERAGFSKEGLARMDRYWEREIAARRAPGAVVAIARDGKLVYYKAFGTLDPATGAPMPFDAIFSIASMTKPMVTVGALAMMEDGRLALRSRLDEYFPAFAGSKVGKVSPTGEVTTQPARQPIYINDLLRHTSGIPYGGRIDTPLHKAWPTSSAGVATSMTGEEFIAKAASLPLVHEPGTVWNYGLSFEVMGLVIEKVAGKPLGAMLKEEVWDKVGMPDTTFQVPEAKRSRLARGLPNDAVTGRPTAGPQLLRANAKFDCGGGCAFSTVPDYVRFGQMLLDGGIFEGRRVISPKSVALMTSDHLGANIVNEVVGIEGYREGYGFGLGVQVRTHEGIAAIPGSIGDYSWNGANGTIWWNDPQERLVVVVGAVAPGEIRKRHREQVVDIVYGAMTEIRAKK